jgi:hypothetical protein
MTLVIADLLPREWRQVMVDAGPYRPTSTRGFPAFGGTVYTVPAPRNAAGECPLGALAAAGFVRYAGVSKYPTPATAARALEAALALPYEECCRAAAEFIRRWDHGEIADLAAALGLSEPAAAARELVRA